MRSLAWHVVVVTLAGMVIASLGESTRSMPWWQGERKIFSVIAGVVQAIVSPATADAAVMEKKITVKVSPPLKLVPSKTKVEKKSLSPTGKLKSNRTRKKGKVARSSSRGKGVGGRCEPQSLTYARQRSGIMRSRNGPENGPLTWFAAEKKLGKTSVVPLPGSVLILGADRGHGMGTGHVAYVEAAYASGRSSYRVVFSHTNYDRRCSLETNIEARYDSESMTLDIFSGAWHPWAKGLKVAGFIEE